MEDSGSSLTFTNSGGTTSGSVQMALPASGVVRESSDSSSRSIRSPIRYRSPRRDSRDRSLPHSSRPPIGGTIRDDSVNRSSSMVPMVGIMSRYPSEQGQPVSQEPNTGTHSQQTHSTYQQYQDHRSIHFHGSPEVAQVSREATEMVSGVVHQANQAVSQARISEAVAHERASNLAQSVQQQMASVANEASTMVSNARAEATTMVYDARVETTQAVARASALESMIQQLRERLDSVTQENQSLRESLYSTVQVTSGTVVAAVDNEAANGARLGRIEMQLGRIESRVNSIEEKLDHHQDYIQELWMQQAPVPPVVVEGGNTPIMRMDQQDAYPHARQDFHMADDQYEAHNTPRTSHGGQVDDVEGRCLRTKELHHLKLPALPESASQFRSWKNAVRTSLLSFDQSTEGLVSPWLAIAFSARGQESELLRTSSGDFPRLDRVIASVLCRHESLKSSFGLRIQAYIEACENHNQQIRGRFLLNLISKEFDTSVAAGAITSSLELFQLPIPQDSAPALKTWHDRVVYILSQLPIGQRPTEDLMSQWIYTSLKRHPLLRRVIDKYHDSSINSHHRSFEALWQGVEKALLEAQHDANTQSLRDDLKKGPVYAKKTAAVTATKGNEKGKNSSKSGSNNPTATSPSTGNKGKGNPKGKGDGKNKQESSKEKPQGSGNASSTSGKPTKQMSAAEKAKSPCIYHSKGRCMRGDACPYSHAAIAQATPKGTSNAPSGTSKVAAAVAILATSAVAESHSGFLEFVGDTGAGENLGSVEAFRKQGMNLPRDFVTTSSKPVQFMTGGATKLDQPQSAFGHKSLTGSNKCTCCLSVR